MSAIEAAHLVYFMLRPEKHLSIDTIQIDINVNSCVIRSLSDVYLRTCGGAQTLRRVLCAPA